MLPQASLQIDPVSWGADLVTRVRRFGKLPAVIDATGPIEVSCTHRDLAIAALRLAQRLERLGVRPGEPVATILPNGLQAVAAGQAVLLAGAAEAAVNVHLTEGEIEHCLHLAGCRVVVGPVRLAALCERLGLTLVHQPAMAGESMDSDRDEEEGDGDPGLTRALVDRTADGDRWARITFTSGTTGKPKAIVHGHARRWQANLLLRGSLPFPPGPGDRLLLMTPYAFGAALLAQAYLDGGASVWLTDGVMTGRVHALLSRQRVNALFAPPTVLAKLDAELQAPRYDGVRLICTGTATLSHELYRRTKARFGPVVRVTYGKSEVYNPITVLQPDDCDRFYAGPARDGISLGWPAPGVEIRIAGSDGSAPADGDIGEILVRARHMMIGELGGDGFQPEAAGAWHATGDAGYLAQTGELMLTGRSGDLIKTGGYKLYPQEIESLLPATTDGAAIVIVGMPSAYWGQVVVAVSDTHDPGWRVRAQAVVSALSAYKHPRAWLSLDVLPRGSQDKVIRARVIERITETFELQDGAYPRFVRRDRLSASAQSIFQEDPER